MNSEKKCDKCKKLNRYGQGIYCYACRKKVIHHINEEYE